jgi:hypothetical protein
MESYEGGAQRSNRKLRYDLIPREIIDAIAERFTIGAAKYGDTNWLKGGNDFFQDARNHLTSHWLAFQNGDLEDEKEVLDHLKAVLWNARIILYHELHKD